MRQEKEKFRRRTLESFITSYDPKTFKHKLEVNLSINGITYCADLFPHFECLFVSISFFSDSKFLINYQILLVISFLYFEIVSSCFLEVRLVDTNSSEFYDSFEESFKLFEKYQMNVHHETNYTRIRYRDFLADSPLFSNQKDESKVYHIKFTSKILIFHFSIVSINHFLYFAISYRGANNF